MRLITRPAPCEAEFERLRLPLPLTTNPGEAIEPGMIPSTPCARRASRLCDARSTSLLHAVDHVLLFPREVVMVLQIEQHLRAEIRRDVLVNERVVRRGVSAHQFHRGPIFLPFLRIQRQPGQPLQLARQIRELAERQSCCNDRTPPRPCRGCRCATATPRKCPRLQSSCDLSMGGEQPELDEMIAAAAGAELRPGAVLVLLRDRADRPIRVQHLMLRGGS